MKKFVRFFSLCALFIVLCSLSLAMIACKPKDIDMTGIEIKDQTVSYTGKVQTPIISVTTPNALKVFNSLPNGRYEYSLNDNFVNQPIFPGVYSVKVYFDVDTTKYNSVQPLEATFTISLIGSKFTVQGDTKIKNFEIRPEHQIRFDYYSKTYVIPNTYIIDVSNTSWQINEPRFSFYQGTPTDSIKTESIVFDLQSNGTIQVKETLYKRKNSITAIDYEDTPTINIYTLIPQE
ncbi:MAG: hypothetical protein NC132_06550 [Corallococcus sp.]|nr:hypothetical protein [Corallococcus sp.]MCM1395744.1 hypothetical protein [Corallococcus sp.]